MKNTFLTISTNWKSACNSALFDIHKNIFNKIMLKRCSFVNIYQFPFESFEFLKIHKVEVPHNLTYEAVPLVSLWLTFFILTEMLPVERVVAN